MKRMKPLIFSLIFLCGFPCFADSKNRFEIYEFVARLNKTTFKVLKPNMQTAHIHCGSHFLWGDYLKAFSYQSFSRKNYGEKPDPTWITYLEGCEKKLKSSLKTLIEHPGEFIIVYERSAENTMTKFEIKKLNSEEKEHYEELKRESQLDELE